MCHEMTGYCAIETTKALHELKPHEHLAWVYELCFEHYATKVHALQSHVDSKVQACEVLSCSSPPIISDTSDISYFLFQ